MRLGFALQVAVLCIGVAAAGLEVVWAHEGHSHASSPSSSSAASAIDLAALIESPLTFSMKTRSGYEGSGYASLAPGVYSFFGDEEISTHFSYEYRARAFLDSSGSFGEDGDQDHFASVCLKKALSEGYRFSVLGEFELNRAGTAARALNDFRSSVVHPSLTRDWGGMRTLSAGYRYTSRGYPNGTYSIPLSRPGAVGEPILPADATVEAADESLQNGVQDVLHELVVAGALPALGTSLSLEGRYGINYSNAPSRRYQGGALRAGTDLSLWKRGTLLVSESGEVRNFSGQKQLLVISELNLIQELSAKVSALGLARYTAVSLWSEKYWWEGYAQLQVVF